MDTLTTPLISILIPTWNRPQGVINLIERINSAKNSDLEIVIVDDNSEEKNWLELKNVASRHKNVRLFRNTHNVGMTNNWNKTIEYAKGTWLGLIHDDDIYKEDALLRLRSYIDKMKAPCLIIQNFNIETPTEALAKGVETVNKMLLPPASGQFWHRDITDKLGGFDKRIKYCPDDEFWVRIGFHYPILKVKDFFVISYQHDKNYMWEIFRSPDFLDQVALSQKERLKYSLGERYKNPILLEYYIKDGIWETLRTLINNTFLTRQMKIDAFIMYLVKFIKLSFELKRKQRMLKIFLRLVVYKFYQPIRPFAKKLKLFISN